MRASQEIRRFIGENAPEGELWDADFSAGREKGPFRYRLRRLWAEGDKPPLVVIGLNPSTADENVLDPTVSRCLGRARRLGYRGLVMLNLFAFRSTRPEGLRRARDPVGPRNDEYLLTATEPGVCGGILCAWGVHGELAGRGETVLGLLRNAGRDLLHLGLTKGGHPRHPLYLGNEVRISPYPRNGRAASYCSTKKALRAAARERA